MMRITVEILPGGDERAAEKVSIIRVWRVGEGHAGMVLYRYSVSGTFNLPEAAKVWHHPSRGAAMLAATVMEHIKQRVAQGELDPRDLVLG